MAWGPNRGKIIAKILLNNRHRIFYNCWNLSKKQRLTKHVVGPKPMVVELGTRNCEKVTNKMEYRRHLDIILLYFSIFARIKKGMY